jgi:hypothetical protein
MASSQITRSTMARQTEEPVLASYDHAAPTGRGTKMREALIVAVDDYEHGSFRRLVTPGNDAESLSAVLESPSLGGFDSVVKLRNPSLGELNRAVERLFRRPERLSSDLLFFYFSGHGVKDDSGHLFLATSESDTNMLLSTSLRASFLNELMARSPARQQVVVLDCCFAGAFGRELTKGGTDIGLVDELPPTRGRVVLAGSSAIEFSFEDTPDGDRERHSVFTSALVDGMETGAADLDGDGWISVDELFTYARDRMVEAQSSQRPVKFAIAQDGDIRVARAPAGARSLVGDRGAPRTLVTSPPVIEPATAPIVRGRHPSRRALAAISVAVVVAIGLVAIVTTRNDDPTTSAASTTTTNASATSTTSSVAKVALSRQIIGPTQIGRFEQTWLWIDVASDEAVSWSVFDQVLQSRGIFVGPTAATGTRVTATVNLAKTGERREVTVDVFERAAADRACAFLSISEIVAATGGAATATVTEDQYRNICHYATPTGATLDLKLHWAQAGQAFVNAFVAGQSGPSGVATEVRRNVWQRTNGTSAGVVELTDAGAVEIEMTDDASAPLSTDTLVRIAASRMVIGGARPGPLQATTTTSPPTGVTQACRLLPATELFAVAGVPVAATEDQTPTTCQYRLGTSSNAPLLNIVLKGASSPSDFEAELAAVRVPGGFTRQRMPIGDSAELVTSNVSATIQVLEGTVRFDIIMAFLEPIDAASIVTKAAEQAVVNIRTGKFT